MALKNLARSVYYLSTTSCLFAPQRTARWSCNNLYQSGYGCLDLSGSAGSQAALAAAYGMENNVEQLLFQLPVPSPEVVPADTYRHSSNLSLHSAMQTCVPEPYAASSPVHVNMPEGGVARQLKYWPIADVSGVLLADDDQLE